MLVLATVDVLFRSLLVMANGDIGTYVRSFNLQNKWSMCFRHLLLFTMVEHTTLILWPLCEWSLLLVRTAVIKFGFGVVPRRWSFPKQWTTSVTRKKVETYWCASFFNVILFCVEVSVVKVVTF